MGKKDKDKKKGPSQKEIDELRERMAREKSAELLRNAQGLGNEGQVYSGENWAGIR
jgi:hypothetical protein